MDVRGWRAWYADGRVVTSRTTAPADLPREGLQIVMLYLTPPYRQILCGGDYLLWNGHQWQSVMEVPTCPTCVVFPGSWMADAAFEALQQTALDAVTF